jgi:GNAT superfamily N-acetyltransferase
MTDSIRIRQARLTERKALEALQWRASLVWEETRELLLAHPDAIELPTAHIAEGHTIVAEVDNAITGFAVVLPREDGESELDGLFVEPGRWRKGIGRALVQGVAQIARRRNSKHLCVIGNERARAFYISCGFVPIGESITRFGAGLTMRRLL